MAKPTAFDLLALAASIEAFAYWLEADPDKYDADEFGRRLEALGVLTPDTWEPPQWLKDAAAKARDGLDLIGPEAEAETNQRLKTHMICLENCEVKQNRRKKRGLREGDEAAGL